MELLVLSRMGSRNRRSGLTKHSSSGTGFHPPTIAPCAKHYVVGDRSEPGSSWSVGYTALPAHRGCVTFRRRETKTAPAFSTVHSTVFAASMQASLARDGCTTKKWQLPAYQQEWVGHSLSCRAKPRHLAANAACGSFAAGFLHCGLRPPVETTAPDPAPFGAGLPTTGIPALPQSCRAPRWTWSSPHCLQKPSQKPHSCDSLSLPKLAGPAAPEPSHPAAIPAQRPIIAASRSSVGGRTPPPRLFGETLLPFGPDREELTATCG